MIDKAKVYDFLVAQAAARSAASIDVFKMFLRLYSAIVGGSIWLSLQTGISVADQQKYALLSNLAVGITTFVVVVMVVDNLRSWHAYRTDISKLGQGPGFSPPQLFPSAISEAAMLLGTLGASVAFWVWNPFLSNSN